MATGNQSTRGAVVVTGASTGIGAACARRLDGMGFRVFAGVRREEDGAELRKMASERLIPILLDVTDEVSIASAAGAVTSAVGESGLIGLVNNAGVAVAGPLEFIPIAELRRQLEINTIGPITVIQAFMPLLRQGHGRVVNIGSISGRVASPFLGPYNASKFALEGLTDALRMELRPWGLHVSIVEPGVVATPIWSKSVAAAERLLHSLPPRAHERYGPAMESLRIGAEKNARSGAGVTPDLVARAVIHALTARRPKTRYLVGRDARVAALVAYAPDRLRDRLIAGSGRIPRDLRATHQDQDQDAPASGDVRPTI